MNGLKVVAFWGVFCAVLAGGVASREGAKMALRPAVDNGVGKTRFGLGVAIPKKQTVHQPTLNATSVKKTQKIIKLKQAQSQLVQNQTRVNSTQFAEKNQKKKKRYRKKVTTFIKKTPPKGKIGAKVSLGQTAKNSTKVTQKQAKIHSNNTAIGMSKAEKKRVQNITKIAKISKISAGATANATNQSEFVDVIERQVIPKTTWTIRLLLLLLLALIVMATIAALSFLAYTEYVSEIRSAVMNGYTEFIEKQLPQRKLTSAQQTRFNDFAWTDEKLEKITASATEIKLASTALAVTRTSYHEGSKFFIEYKDSVPKSLFPPNFVLDPAKAKERVFYFEVEVFYLHDTTNAIIGYASPESLSENRDRRVGEYEGSVGYNIRTGEVMIDNERVHTFDFTELIQQFHDVNESGLLESTGNFYGIGVNFHTGVYFFTFNGVVLNSISFQAQTELRYKIYDMRKKDLLTNEEGIRSVKKLNQLVRKVQMDKKYRDQMKTVKEFQCKLKSATPVVWMNALTKLEVNIGAFPFQLRDRELKHGLLWEKD